MSFSPCDPYICITVKLLIVNSLMDIGTIEKKEIEFLYRLTCVSEALSKQFPHLTSPCIMHLYWKCTWHGSQLDSGLVLKWVASSPNKLLMIQCLECQSLLFTASRQDQRKGVCTTHKRATRTISGTVPSPSFFFTIIFVMINHCAFSENETLQRPFCSGSNMRWKH